MSIVVPSAFLAPGILDVTTGEIIDDTDYSDIFEALHYLWSRTGCRAHGRILDPVLTTTSTTYVTTGLSTFHPFDVLTRAAYNSGTRVYLRALTIIAANARVQYGSSLIATAVGAGMQQVTGLQLVTGGPGRRTPSIPNDLQWRVDVAGTGRLAQYKIHEAIDVTSYLS